MVDVNRTAATLRKMTSSHLDDLMRLKDAEGWNQLEEDWELLINYEKSINLVAIQDDNIVGSITAINYDSTVVWIGMMLVARDYRGRGISKLLLNDVIEKSKKVSSIKLDATPAGKPVYLKLGFVCEKRLFRMTNPSFSTLVTKAYTPTPVLITHQVLPEIISLDKMIFGAGRSELIKRLYQRYPELAWLIRDGGKITGFCLGRRGQNFTQIGPVYASSEIGAKALIRSAGNHLAGKPVVVDIHADKAEMIKWFEGNGFTSLRPFDRMFLKNNSNPGIKEYQYLICGPELG